MATKTKSPRFAGSFDDDPILDGGTYIAADLGGGVMVRCYAKINTAEEPADWFNEEDIAAFNRDELRAADLELRVYIDGKCIEDYAGGLGGVWVGGRDGDGDYMTERANDILAENLREIVQTVRDFATAAADAADEVDAWIVKPN